MTRICAATKERARDDRLRPSEWSIGGGGHTRPGGLARILEGHGISAARVTVAFTDDNGPKGERAMRCAVGVTLPRRPPVHVERTSTTARRALDGVLDALERDLARLIERRRDAARRPKKYYAAKKLSSQRGSAERP